MMDKLRRSEWLVRPVDRLVALNLVEQFHYAKGAANTATYCHGLFRKGQDLFDGQCQGVTWWIPPTRTAAKATYPENWQGVLALSRLVIVPDVPSNACSFLLSNSMRLIDRSRWPCLVTYADEWRGHTGAIYRATNWTYCGLTAPEAVYCKNGRMMARKAGPRTRTHAEMLTLGALSEGRFAKHKFKHIVAAE
jgi:hypothetical protein